MADPVTGLFSALCEIFGLMLVGFVVFRLELLHPSDMKGLSWFTARVAFPTLIFSVVATMDVEHLDFSILCLIFFTKIIVALISWLIPVCLMNTPYRFLTAAVYSASTSGSNDAAFGIPLVTALYPQFLPLLTSILVGNTIYGNTIGLFTWELGAAKRDQAEQAEQAAVVGTSFATGASWTSLELTQVMDSSDPWDRRQPLWQKILKNFSTNTLVVLSVLGLIYRFGFSWTLVTNKEGKLELPPGLKDLCNAITGAFTPLMLFQMGECVEQNLTALQRPKGLLIPLFLTALKLLVTPALLLMMVHWFVPNPDPKLESFLLMYGLIPVSETVIILSIVYKAVTPETASVVLLTHAVCAPLIFFGNIYLQGLSSAQWGGQVERMRFVLAFFSFVFILMFLVSFALMRERWCKFPMLSQLLFAGVMGIYTLLSWASITSQCNRFVHAARQSVLLTGDLMVMACTVMFALRSRCAMRESRLWAIAIALCVFAPLPVYLFAAVTEEPRAAPVLGTKCYRAFPLEDWFNPGARSFAFTICLIAMISALAQHNSHVGWACENGQHCLTETYIYLMAGLAMLNWLIQMVLGFAQPGGEGGRFLIFVTAVLYDFYPIVQCLMLSFRSLVLERWRHVVRSYCPRRRQRLMEAAPEEEEGMRAESFSLNHASVTTASGWNG